MSRHLLPILVALLAAPAAGQTRWWKGNTHTHTLWSDGDAAPEVAAKWYRDHGYHFLVLSDHNILQEGERWFRVAEDENGRLKPSELDALVDTFGEDQVTLRQGENGFEMRLLTLDELRARFEGDGRFVMITGEEVTAHWTSPEGGNLPVHINAVNIAGYIPPRRGETVVDLMNDTLDAIAAHGREHGRPVLAHVNHPNFGWGVTWMELAQVRAERFFEVYNGHQGVRNHGDAEHPSTDEMWDRALVLRLTALDLEPLYGVAVDDAHNYHGAPTSQPGRGWVMVRAEELSAEALIGAMQRGEFYASSGVTLRDVSTDKQAYRVAIEAEPGVKYTTRFLGTRVRGDAPGEPGEILLETGKNPAVYRFEGDELYVRAVVVSSREHPNPFAAGDLEQAWTQPIVRPASRSGR